MGLTPLEERQDNSVKKHTLKTNGNEDLVFQGELLGGATARPSGCQERTRWMEIDIYRTDKGSYVVAISNQTLWQGEDKVFLCEKPEEVKAALGIDNQGMEENMLKAAKKALEEASAKDEGLKKLID